MPRAWSNCSVAATSNSHNDQRLAEAVITARNGATLATLPTAFHERS